MLGFRPQSVQLDHDPADSNFEGELMLLEPVDDRALATVSWDRGELRGLVPTRQDHREGEPVGITIDTRNLYLFDADTRELIAKSQPGELEIRHGMNAE